MSELTSPDVVPVTSYLDHRLISIRHTRQHGTIVYGTRPGDPAGKILYAAGFRGSENLDAPPDDDLGDAYWYLPHSRRRRADRLKIDQVSADLKAARWDVQALIDDITPATGFWALEDERHQRAQHRAARLERKGQRIQAEADTILTANDQTYKALNGTPLLVDHHSFNRHKRLLERLWKRDGQAYAMVREADRLLGRAQAARDFRSHREDHGTTLRRIAGLEKQLRDIERTMAGRVEWWSVEPLVEGVESERDRRSRELTERAVPFEVVGAVRDGVVQARVGLSEHIKQVLIAETIEAVEEIGYWEDLIAASGKKVWGRADFAVGDFALVGGSRWREVVRVGVQTISVPDRLTAPDAQLQTMAGLAHHMRHPTTGTVRYDQVRGKLTAEQAREQFPQAFSHEDLPPLPERAKARRGKVKLTQQGGPQHEHWYFRVRGQAYHASWRQPDIWYGPPTPIGRPEPIQVFKTFGLIGRPAELVTQLPVPAGVRWREQVVNVLRAWVEPYAQELTGDSPGQLPGAAPSTAEGATG